LKKKISGYKKTKKNGISITGSNESTEPTQCRGRETESMELDDIKFENKDT